MASLKQTEPKEAIVDGVKFYIRPLPAFKAANLTGELASVLAPLFASFASLFNDNDKKENNDGLMDIEIEEAAPLVSKAFEGISGDKVEILLKKLLISNKNIAVKFEDEEGEEEIEVLTEEIANEIFCGEVQSMFILAYHVIRLNFNGFFKKLAAPSGKAGEFIARKMRKVF